MSISAKLQQFRTSPRIILNDKFIGDQAANQLSNILSTHPNLQSLQLKSNDLSAQGLIPIFQALSSNSTMLKELNIEHNNLGSNDYIQWHQQLNTMIEMSKNLVYLNLSNNKISSEGFLKLCQAIVRSKSLKLVQFRYNNIGGEAVAQFAKMLKDFGNEVLLFVELAGNKVKKDVIDGIQIILNKNRAKNPITKQKLIANVSYTDHQADLNRTHNQVRSTGSIPHDNITIYLEQLLDQTRQDNAQTKIRLQAQLLQLQKRERQDALQLNELQKNCNELQIINRNLKFQLDRTISQHQQLQKDQQSHLRHHEQKIRQGSKQLQELELKYTEIEGRMNKEHQIKMKEIVRDWESRLRAVEEKIRSVESENVGLQGQIRKGLEKRERLRLELVQEQNGVRSRVHEQQIQRFNLKVKSLQSKLRQLQTTKQGHVFRNQDLVQQLQRQNKQSSLEIEQLQKQLEDLKAKQVQFNARSKDFFAKNQKIKAQIQLKQITIDKLEEQISRLDRQVEQKSAAEEEQLAKVRENFELTRYNRQNQRSTRLQRLNQTENALRAAQLENGKLRQEYGLLAQKLQVGLSLAVHKVFEENSLYQ